MSFQVVPAEIGKHAANVDGIAERLGTVLSAANTAAMSDEAYGLICAFVPPFINPAEEKTIDSIKAAIDGVKATAANLRTAERSYSEQDAAGVDMFKQYEAAIPATPKEKVQR
ncbi:type VII secretion target [Amycolatopsis sp. EV170708-02-1]|uniref:type VII secretion target n=1 Tax=Amycolatopsis sp. EV170708-02-1 TaxID=2919322 RepID=UPI001F0BE61F|nr:type VII secretion target [Amycolatopsis sp. EV170708-02-1]UMO99287.1 type VII secretion target [Amycolatopsis sp. EV170708-02-1]